MTSRRLRESPRMVAATVLVGGLLVLIGILVASTTAGGTTHTSAAALPPSPATHAPTPAKASAAAKPNAQQTAALHSDQTTIAQLRASLRSQGNELSSASARVRAAQANARCLHQKVIHPIKTRGVRCALPA